MKSFLQMVADDKTLSPSVRQAFAPNVTQDADELRTRIDRLMRTAETGEQWAEICRLEALMYPVAA